MSRKTGLQLKLLGELEVVRDGVTVALPPSKKTRALLAYLVASGRAHRRERLCSLFWDLPDDPRGALRWSLSKLRALVDEPDRKRIVAEGDSVAFDSTNAVVDLFAVRECLADGLEAASTGQLEVLVKAYRGEFMEGLELPSCLDFRAWCVAEREEAHRLQAVILRTLIERLAPEPEAALAHARALAQLDPYDETARAGLMRLLASTGRRREAAQHYQAGGRLLKEIGGDRSDVLERAWQEVGGGVGNVVRGGPTAPARPARDSRGIVAADGPTYRGEPLELPAEPSIVVLPFANASDDADQDYFSDGMTEDLIAALSNIRSWFVIAHGSAGAFRGQPVDVRQVASRLGVAYVLEGSAQRAGDRVRVAARLHDGSSGDCLWAKQYDRRQDDSFVLLGELAVTIADAIDPALARDMIERASNRRSHDPQAIDRCRRGLWHLRRGTKNDLDEALALFQLARELDPTLCRSLSGMAETYHQMVDLGFADSATESHKAALRAAREAVDVDPEDALAHRALGNAHIMRREHEAAVPAFERAVALNPCLASAYHGLGACLVFSGRPRDAIPPLERAIRLSPHDRNMGAYLERMADARLLMREHDEAAGLARTALRYPETRWSRYAVLISALGHLDRLDEARCLLDEVLRHWPDFTLEFVREAHLFVGHVTLAYVAEPQLFTDQDEFAHYLDGLRKAGVAQG